MSGKEPVTTRDTVVLSHGYKSNVESE